MKFTFVPEYRFKTFDMATVDFLVSKGIKGIVLDVDNTLEPYENPLPTERVVLWLDSLRQNGIKAAIVSNNNSERIDLFNRDLGFPAYSKSGKPFKKNILKAMADMGTTPENTILMGDQVFTDVLAGKVAKMNTTVLVKPINDKKNLFFRFKRLLEKPVIYTYNRREKKKTEKGEA